MSGWFQRLVEAVRTRPEPRALGTLAVDMHAHWLPDLDDGAKDMTESLSMLRGFAERGYSHAIATPHIMGDHYRNTPEGIREALDQVRQAASAEGLTIGLDAAAEYYLDDTMLALLEGEVLTFGADWLLFELSYLNRPSNLQDAIFRIQTRGLKPLLAHPERYPYFYEGSSLVPYRELAEQGVALQINIGSLAGAYGPGAQRVGRELVEAGLVTFLGTDLHGPNRWSALDELTQDRSFHRALDLCLPNHNALLAQQKSQA